MGRVAMVSPQGLGRPLAAGDEVRDSSCRSQEAGGEPGAAPVPDVRVCRWQPLASCCPRGGAPR